MGSVTLTGAYWRGFERAKLRYKIAAHNTGTATADDAFLTLEGAANNKRPVLPDGGAVIPQEDMPLAPLPIAPEQPQSLEEMDPNLLDTLAAKSTQGHVGPISLLRHLLAER